MIPNHNFCDLIWDWVSGQISAFFFFPVATLTNKKKQHMVLYLLKYLRSVLKERCTHKLGWLTSELLISFFPHESESKVAQLCLTCSDSMDCSLPGSSVHGIFQARVLKWVAVSFSRDRTRVPRIVDRRFTVWATREQIVNNVVLMSYREEWSKDFQKWAVHTVIITALCTAHCQLRMYYLF